MNPFEDIDHDGSDEAVRGLFRVIAEELGQKQAYAALAVEKLEIEQMLELNWFCGYEAHVAAEFDTALRSRLALLEKIANEIALVGLGEVDPPPRLELVWCNPAMMHPSSAAPAH